MKTLFLSAILLVAIGFTAIAQKKSIKVPAKVMAAFTQKFPGATAPKWEMENAREYEVNFKENGNEASANFDAAGNWMETEAKIETAALPAAVTAAAVKIPGNKITGAYKIDRPNTATTYEVEIKNGKKKSEMILNADGTKAK